MPPLWTPDLVAERLVAAFRRLPHHPVMSRGRAFTDDDGVEVEAFGWPGRFVSNRQDRSLVMIWARCRASGERVAPLYRDLYGDAERADYRRRAVIAAIARGLNAAEQCNAGLTIPDAALEPVD